MLVDVLLDTARRSPSVTAVSDGVRELSYKQLATLSGVMRDIIASGTSRDRVGIMLPASTAFPAVLFGTLWCKKIAIPLNFLLQDQELKHVIQDAGIDTIITVKHFAELCSKLPANSVFLEDLPLKRKMVFAALKRYAAAPEVMRDDLAVILYTSGTSAEPKGVELTYGNLHSNCVDSLAMLRIDPRQVFLNILPPFHVFGLTANVLVPIFLGSTVHAIPRFSPVAAIKTIEEKKITILLAIPSMYSAMLRTKSTKPDAFQSIHLAMSGGEPLAEQTRIGFQERFGVSIRQGYGLTETSPVVTMCTVDLHKPGTVGKPIRNAEIQIRDADDKVLPQGTDGEIFIRGPGVMKGYHKRPEQTRAVLDERGWFRTGDIGCIDADGFLSITGRAKEMLIIGGENVFPREIEAVLENHEAVAQAAVIGIPDGLRGEVPVAFVIPKKDEQVTADELRNFARKSLASHKTPRRIEVREELPTGPTGKILKRKLRDLV
jgi:long-chain acyl-CoA synthetase